MLRALQALGQFERERLSYEHHHRGPTSTIPSSHSWRHELGIASRFIGNKEDIRASTGASAVSTSESEAEIRFGPSESSDGGKDRSLRSRSPSSGLPASSSITSYDRISLASESHHSYESSSTSATPSSESSSSSLPSQTSDSPSPTPSAPSSSSSSIGQGKQPLIVSPYFARRGTATMKQIATRSQEGAGEMGGIQARSDEGGQSLSLSPIKVKRRTRNNRVIRPLSPPMTPLPRTIKRQAICEVEVNTNKMSDSTDRMKKKRMDGRKIGHQPPTPDSIPRSSARIRQLNSKGTEENETRSEDSEEDIREKKKGELVVEIPLISPVRRKTKVPAPRPGSDEAVKQTKRKIKKKTTSDTDPEKAPISNGPDTRRRSVVEDGNNNPKKKQRRKKQVDVTFETPLSAKGSKPKGGRGKEKPNGSLEHGGEKLLTANEKGVVEIVGKIHLIQEKLRYNPWKMLIATSLLNKTTGRAARPILEILLKRWPTPQDLAEASIPDLATLLYPLGLFNQRAASLVRFSRQYLDYKWPLYEYAADAHPFHTADLPPLPAPDPIPDLHLRGMGEEDDEASSDLTPPPDSDTESGLAGTSSPQGNRKRQLEPKKRRGRLKPKKSLEYGVGEGHPDVKIFHGSGIYASDSFRIYSHLLPGRGGPEKENKWLRRKKRALTRLRERGGTTHSRSEHHSGIEVERKSQGVNEGQGGVDVLNEGKEVDEGSGWDGGVEQLSEWLSDTEDGDETEGEEEWRKVRPADKELRRYLIWRWGIEGIVYDIHSGPRIDHERDSRRLRYLLQSQMDG